MPLPETGKQRAERIPLDYFRHADRLERWKGRLLLAAVLVTGAWVISGWVWSDWGRQRASRGPVTDVHAMWDNDCTACHVPFTPIKQTWASAWFGDPHASNQRCQSCHDGPPHHKTAQRELACASCHREHRGRDASLVRLADSDCTQCHSNLSAHTEGGKPGYENAITRFDRDHPEFKVLDLITQGRVPVADARDPGRLKFNHKLHMTRGMVLKPQGKPFTLEDILNSERQRYRDQQPEELRGDRDPVQLDCASCHRLDGADYNTNRLQGLAAETLLPVRSAGRYMLPITYENTCRACHPLTFDRELPAVAVPHRLQPDEVRNFLWGAYATHYTDKEHPDLLAQGQVKRLRPGWPTSEEERKIRDALMGKVGKAEKFLYRDKLEQAERVLYPFRQTCGECHYYEMAKPQDVVPRRIVPLKVPDVWFPHGVFDHAAHRAVNCRECHARAYADDPKASTDTEDVLIPGIANCRQCHAPRTNVGGTVHGGVRFNCTECHRYHNGDHPLQGIGARSRDPKHRMEIQQLLKGAPKK